MKTIRSKSGGSFLTRACDGPSSSTAIGEPPPISELTNTPEPSSSTVSLAVSAIKARNSRPSDEGGTATHFSKARPRDEFPFTSLLTSFAARCPLLCPPHPFHLCCSLWVAYSERHLAALFASSSYAKFGAYRRRGHLAIYLEHMGLSTSPRKVVPLATGDDSKASLSGPSTTKRSFYSAVVVESTGPGYEYSEGTYLVKCPRSPISSSLKMSRICFCLWGNRLTLRILRRPTLIPPTLMLCTHPNRIPPPSPPSSSNSSPPSAHTSSDSSTSYIRTLFLSGTMHAPRIL